MLPVIYVLVIEDNNHILYLDIFKLFNHITLENSLLIPEMNKLLILDQSILMAIT